MSDTTMELERLRSDLEVLERCSLEHGGMASCKASIQAKIARLEAEQADPWREAKRVLDERSWLDPAEHREEWLVINYVNGLTAERDRLAARVVELERHVATAVQVGSLYRQASFQSHSGHWDSTMQRGKGCPECIRANDLRKEADEMMDQEKFPDPDDPILDPARVLATAGDIMNDAGFGATAYTLSRHAKDAKPYRLKGGENV